ncbi:uncharacterized protein METZ01_LOCUS29720 [marine metagenome]|uniref:Uncharacterized protein n=1 Tax=marine metagenome TaxID=408172 RepID=A0A381QC36_9ZZZZ
MTTGSLSLKSVKQERKPPPVGDRDSTFLKGPAYFRSMASLGMILQAPPHEVIPTTPSEQGTTHQVASKGGIDSFEALNHT